MRGAALLVLLGLMAGAPAAAVETLPVDAEASRVDFEVRLAWLKRITGRLQRIEGEVRTDQDRQRVQVVLRIAAAAIDMPRQDHANWARSTEFFDAARHPWILFDSEWFPAAVLREGGEIGGTVELRGQRRQTRLFVRPTACERPGRDCPVQARAQLRRSAFGMTTRQFVLSDRVDLSFSLQVRGTPPGPAESAR